MQRYQPIAGHGPCPRDNEEGENSQKDPSATVLHEDDQSSKSAEKRQGFADNGSSSKKKEERMGGDGSNTQNCREGNLSQAKTDASDEKECQEPSGSAKITKKVRKPDREFYQPGSRRNVQGKGSGVGREQGKPPPGKQEQTAVSESQLSTGVREGKKKISTQKQGGKERVKAVQEVGSQDVEMPQLGTDDSVNKIRNKIEKMNIKERGKLRGRDEATGELTCGAGETSQERRGQGLETKLEEEKPEKKVNSRRKGVEREKEKNLETKGEDGGGKNNQGKSEKLKEKKASESPLKKMDRAGETHQNKTKENRRENRKRNDNSSSSRDAEKDVKTPRKLDRCKELHDRHQSSATTPTSKRYSKSDIRHSRNRTYSSSSGSSVTSQNGPGRGMDVKCTKWSRLDSVQNNKEGMGNREGRRSHLQSWTNYDSSSESLEGSEIIDKTENRRRRRKGEEEISTERPGERNKKSNKGGGRGILNVSQDKPSCTPSHSSEVKNCKQGLIPRGRGGGILVLPARTDISNSPEVGQRLLPGGIRGGATCRSRGGRGGGVRRLWDPNNPDQKPALTGTRASQHSSVKQPVYLQTGTGYGQLHFLDTDDEVAGSPPLPQGEHFQSQQAMAYYKFQNSDNPYCYPMATANLHNPNATAGQRFPYPYNVGPYQMAHSNGVYQSPGINQLCGTYRGAGYSQPGVEGGLTFEEAEQQTRGELGRLLKTADTHELQLSNLLSRDRVSADGLDRMALLR